LNIWNQELDRHGAPPDRPLIAQHELMNTPDKLQAMLQRSGFQRAEIKIMPWSHQASLRQFTEQHRDARRNGQAPRSTQTVCPSRLSPERATPA
jgi:hypothetical protein